MQSNPHLPDFPLMLRSFLDSLLRLACGFLAIAIALVMTGCGEEEAGGPPSSAALEAPHPSLLYGRVVTYGGDTFEGRLRWGGGEEAFWGDYFNGTMDDNPWAEHVPAEHLLTERAVSREVGEKLVDLIRWWEDYTARNRGTMDNNPSPGNKAGGLTTILEKSLGAAAKCGTTPLTGVYKYAEEVTNAGVAFMEEVLEDVLEVGTDGLEGLVEFFRGGLVDLGDGVGR